jgi:hypothetical protein
MSSQDDRNMTTLYEGKPEFVDVIRATNDGGPAKVAIWHQARQH